MYDELYNAWLQEIRNDEIGRLTPDFYRRMDEYLEKIKEEIEKVDKKTLRAILLEREMENAQRIVHELVWFRYKKFINKFIKGQETTSDLLTSEEQKLCSSLLPMAEKYRRLVDVLLKGPDSKLKAEKDKNDYILRFVRSIPAIIGSDMIDYGPFSLEEIASLPAKNANILIKHGLAEKIEC